MSEDAEVERMWMKVADVVNCYEPNSYMKKYIILGVIYVAMGTLPLQAVSNASSTPGFAILHFYEFTILASRESYYFWSCISMTQGSYVGGIIAHKLYTLRAYKSTTRQKCEIIAVFLAKTSAQTSKYV